MTPMRIMVYPRFVEIGRWANALVRTVTGKHRLRSPEKDLDIQPERPRSRIFEIEPDHVVEREPASPVDLPEASDSGLHLNQSPPVPDIVDLELVGDRGPRADQRHFPLQDIENLWELVQTGLSQERPNASDPRILGELVDDFVACL